MAGLFIHRQLLSSAHTHTQDPLIAMEAPGMCLGAELAWRAWRLGILFTMTISELHPRLEEELLVSCLPPQPLLSWPQNAK